VLSKDNCQLCLAAVQLHVGFRDEFMRLAREASSTGEPMLRSLEYEFPHQGYALVKDQFLLGKQILAAPVLVSGARKRSIIIPPGLWRDDRGIVTQGPEKIEVDAPLDRLPWWRCIG
jgi:alpha-glucosidase (family GH31 glycosyl hydrolase)